MPLVEVFQLVKRFERRTLFRRRSPLTAVDGVTFGIEAGETFGLVGESGSGKSTTARCLLRLMEPTSGSVMFRDQEILTLPAGSMRALRREMQVVFQDPYSSLNPRMRAGQIVEEPLVVHGIGTRRDRTDRARELFQVVGLEPSGLDHYPHQFSGGQRQRICIARALALNPSFIVLDEPVSALDVSIQGQIVNLLVDLQARLGLTYLFIAHDLRLVQHMCSRIAVMYRGTIVEMGATASVFAAPRHPYTRALLSAIPTIDPNDRRPRVVFDGRTFSSAGLREVERGHWAAV